MLFYLLILGTFALTCVDFSSYFKSQSERPRVSDKRFEHCLFMSRVAECLATAVFISGIAGTLMNTLPLVTGIYTGITLVFVLYASIKEAFDRAKLAHETE